MSISILEDTLLKQFASTFDTAPEQFIASPGRVNIIGEYTDFNGGFVLPMAIDRYLVLAVKKRNDHLVRVISTDFKDRIEFSLEALQQGAFNWGEYVTGCFWALQQEGHSLRGFDAIIATTIPVGASLSSSAALELGILRAAAYSSDVEWDPVSMAKLGQLAENTWVGMNCGIMDQIACACGRQDHALLIDCRDLALRHSPLPENSSIIILDTSTRRGLIDSAYNERRNQCFEAAGTMHVALLRDADEQLLQQYKKRLSLQAYQRAKHIIFENKRVLQAAEAMENNQSTHLGRLMYESHLSLRDTFEVSGEALNVMVESAMEHDACFGSRMTGAGFAGCAVALIEKGREDEFMHAVGVRFTKRMNMQPQLYVCKASNGVTIRPV